MKKGFFSQIGGKLTLIISGVGIVVAAVSIAIALFMSSNELHKANNLRLKNMAIGTYEYTASWFERRRDDIYNFSENTGNRLVMTMILEDRTNETLDDGRTARARLKDDVQVMFKNMPYYMEMYVMDDKGHVHHHTSKFEERDGLGIGRELADKDYFQEGRKGLYVSKIYLSAEAAKILSAVGENPDNEAEVPTMFISAPIHDKTDTKVLGVVAFRLLYDSLESLFKEKRFGDTGETYMFNANLEFVSDSRFTEQLPADVRSRYGIKKNATLRLKLDAMGYTPKGIAEAVKTKSEGSFLTPYKNYRGELVYGYWNWMPSVDKGVISEISAAEIDEGLNMMTAFMIGVGVVLAIIAAVIALFLARTISQPLGVGVTILSNVAKGDLTKRVDPALLKRGDEIGDLSRSLDTMIEDISAIVANVVSGTESIALASQQISEGNQNLSQRTEEQAASLEETASSMEEMASAIKQTSENSLTANNMVKDTQNATQRGVEGVQRTIGQMTEISEASQKISDITKVIENIAFQTNILALNAAVEAARAGEMGKGFAVVASEVRTLAQNTSASVKDIGGLIQNSVDQIRAGNQEVESLGSMLNEINEGVNNVVDIMNEISSAAAEQQNGVEQVNKAVTDMDTVTQQNASLVEEAASASEEMSSQAQELASLMGFFKVKNEGGSMMRKKASPQSSNIKRKQATAHLPAPAPRDDASFAKNAEKEEFEEF